MTKWTKCSEKMPPNDDSEYVIIYTYPGSKNEICSGVYLHLAVTHANANLAMWTPHTKQLWDELNVKQT